MGYKYDQIHSVPRLGGDEFASEEICKGYNLRTENLWVEVYFKMVSSTCSFVLLPFGGP